MQRYAGITRTSDRRRARTLAGSLLFILAGAALYAHHSVKAAEQRELASKARTFIFVAAAVPCTAGAQTHWDAARRECVDVPGAAATAALSSSLS